MSSYVALGAESCLAVRLWETNFFRRQGEGKKKEGILASGRCDSMPYIQASFWTMNEVNLILKAVRSLEARYPGRKFTIGGTFMGSLGEVMAEQAYDIKLLKQGAKDHDAIDGKDRKIQIRINSRNATPLKAKLPEYLLALKFTRSGGFEEVYNGPGKILKSLLKGRKPDTSGFIAIQHTKLRSMMCQINISDRVSRRI